MVRIGDAFGQTLLDELEGRPERGVFERDDGWVEPTADTAGYLRPRRRWRGYERRAMRYVRGRVLDVGCGAGRVALDLQERGHDVVAVDVSPHAVEVCRRRGVRDVRLLAFADVDAALGLFDTVVMLGNNFGLFEAEVRCVERLRRLRSLTTGRGRIVAASQDPYRTDDADHLAYHARNRARGRLGGQVRLRIRRGDLATPWFDYLFVSPDEMAGLAHAGGWRLERVVPDVGARYVGVLEKAP